jgi:hypothetical protein
MSQNNIQNRKFALASEFVRIMNEGFPEKEMKRYGKKVASLPDEHRKELEKLNKLVTSLGQSLSGR